MRWYPSKEQIKQSWEKYGLIVVGNIVFFALLYFISYRPNNDENRAAEFLSMAQAQETQGRHEAAMALYEQVVAGYPETRAADTARQRLPGVRKRLVRPPRPEPELIPPRLDLAKMLNRRPAVYVAAFLAEHYHDDPAQRPKIHAAIKKYLGIAAIHEGVDLRELRGEREFQDDLFQREFFDIRPKCVMAADWVYDDFFVENTNFFSWSNVNIKLTVAQGERTAEQELRIPRLDPGGRVELLEFRVSGSSGVVRCGGELTATEGATSWSEEI